MTNNKYLPIYDIYLNGGKLEVGTRKFNFDQI